MTASTQSRRVAIADPDIDVAEATRLFAPIGATAVFQRAQWAGPDVVGLILSPTDPFTAADAARCPNLRVVVTTSTGYDNIDLEVCRRRAIAVWHPTDYCSTEVADSAIAHLVGLLRGITVLDREVRDGRWHFADAGTLRRFDATRLGIVGFGTIGRKVAARAQALGMEVAGFDPVLPADVFERAGVRRCELDELFTRSTAITIHVPLLPTTRGLVSERLLRLMPPDALLVNLARGEVLDMDALVRALDDGRIARASVDVLGVEPPTDDAPAPVHPRLVVTPHAAWFSEEAADILFHRPLRVVRDVLTGRPPADVLP